jgi:hypothetical protein
MLGARAHLLRRISSQSPLHEACSTNPQSAISFTSTHSLNLGRNNSSFSLNRFTRSKLSYHFLTVISIRERCACSEALKRVGSSYWKARVNKSPTYRHLSHVSRPTQGPPQHRVTKFVWVEARNRYILQPLHGHTPRLPRRAPIKHHASLLPCLPWDMPDPSNTLLNDQNATYTGDAYAGSRKKKKYMTKAMTR